MKHHEFPRPVAKDRLIKFQKPSYVYLLMIDFPCDFQPPSSNFIKVFNMMVMKKPIGFAFYTFKSSIQREKFRNSVFSTNQDISLSHFDQVPFLTNQSTEKMFLETTLLFRNRVSEFFCNFEKGKSRSELESLEVNFKQTSRKCLWEIILFLEECFFLSSTSDYIQNKWTDKVFICHLLFGALSNFLLQKDYYKNKKAFMDKTENIKKLLQSLEPFERIPSTLKIPIIDFFYQLLFLKNQFINQKHIWKIIYDTPGCEIQNLQSLNKKLYKNIIEIMDSGYKKIAPDIKKSEYIQIVDKTLKKVFLLDMPESLHGFTSFDSTILIKFPISPDDDLKFKTTMAYIFLTFLHEFGHVLQRKNFQLKSEWFNHLTPKASESSDTEGGKILIKKVFGIEPQIITFNAASYILNPYNWRSVAKKTFQSQFKTENSKVSKGSDLSVQSIRLKQSTSYSSIPLMNCCRRPKIFFRA